MKTRTFDLRDRTARLQMLEKLPRVLGQILKGFRAGLEKIAFQRIDLRHGTAMLKLRSPAFADHMPIPARYTADGEALSPPLQWSDVPRQARSLALIVEDADSPSPQPLVHAIAVGLAPCDGELAEGALTQGGPRCAGLKIGRSSDMRRSWLPPDPPPGHGPHRYAFQLFALAGDPGFSGAPGRSELLDALREHALASGCLIGIYARGTEPAVDVREGQPA